jgi:hypothetical protein
MVNHKLTRGIHIMHDIGLVSFKQSRKYHN